MTNVSQTSVLSVYAQKHPVESSLWNAIQADKNTEEPVAAAIAMAKDVLVENSPAYLRAFNATFNPSGRYAPYSIMLMSKTPKFANRKSKKRSRTVLGWVYSFLSKAGLSEQLTEFERSISDRLPD